MEYQGKLYGKVGNHYFPLLHDTDYVHNLENKVKELESNSDFTIINSQDDLPKEYTECHFVINHNEVLIGAYTPYKNRFAGLDDDYDAIREVIAYRVIKSPNFNPK